MANPSTAHDLSVAENGTLQNGSTSKLYGANPPPAWSHFVGPEHRAPGPVATQLVVPTELSDGPVTLTCVHCQEHITTRTKTGPSTLSWALCTFLCIFACWPCCLVPFCCSSLNVTEHYCEKCGKIGSYKGWKKSKN